MNAILSRRALKDAAPLAPPRAAIKLEGVDKTFSARAGQTAVAALRDVTLAIPEGAIVGVIGRSGAGKSTLIRLVNGLERATSGQITLFGEGVTQLDERAWREKRRSIGMIFQHFNLLSSRTVADNIALPLEIAGAARSAIEEKVSSLLELVDLTDKRDRYPSELSGGQKQRVGIARALATDPKILLCDEATSALDPETTQSILTLLRQVNRALGVTILLITHEIPVIKAICDRVAVLENGEIIEQGAVFDIFTNPRHLTTRRFIESATGVSTPPELAARLQATPIADGQAILRIRFSGRHATAPVLSRITSVIGVDVNIIAGRIDEIGEQPFGDLIVSVPSAQPALAAIIAALSNLDLTTETIGYVA
ncbi:methionine ABC transporter ATP-binding protein [Terrarubrum flagellatum]|uniref:methionine ABC transporter ATP-binding protein n=1 Tax=Terrirubrum flagellatum TaxID=2895980 RepID=UPI003145706F